MVGVPSTLLAFAGVLARESISEVPRGLFLGCCHSCGQWWCRKGLQPQGTGTPPLPLWRLSGCLPRAPWQLCRRSARPSGLGPRAAGTGGVQPHSRAGIAGQPPCQAPLWPHCHVRQALPLSRTGGPRSQCTEGEAKGASAHLWLLRVKHRWGSALVPRRWLCRPQALGDLLVSGCPCWAGGCACSPPSLAVFLRSRSCHT